MSEDWADSPRMTESELSTLREHFEQHMFDCSTEDGLRLVAELSRERTAREHLRRRVRELLRRLPVDLPAEASNMRLIVAALVSETTERMESQGFGG